MQRKFGMALAALALLASSGHAAAAKQALEVRRTTDGIAHVRAGNWRDLGFGVGHAQAQDALCTLGEAFVTFEGRRSQFFGPQARPDRPSTFGQARNLDLDFFFLAFADAALVARYRQAQTAEFDALMEGFAQGYNRYLDEVQWQTRPSAARRHVCSQAPWLRHITADDLYRRLYATHLAAGYARFIPEIVNARPPVSNDLPAPPASEAGMADLQAKLARGVGDQDGLGSNMIALGRQATGENGAVLLGNPHWYWGGPDRYYQMHLTIPGQLNVAGVSFLGIPVVMIGFNAQIAWSHTVSRARRFGLFELKLDPQNPTRYEVDGAFEPMRPTVLTVTWQDERGATLSASRTLYRTRFGPVLDLGDRAPAFGWSHARALAIRDINADNFRIYRNFMDWGRARSLDDFIAIQRRDAAMPWVNTAAIGRGDGRVWYSEIGAVPHVLDAWRAGCASPLSQAFGAADMLTPVLDGRRSSCDWPSDPGATQAGALPASAMPTLLREDYVANMNDSHWLVNARQPLEGYPLVMGAERQALSLRGQLGHEMALSLLKPDGGPRSAQALGRRLMRQALVPRAHSAERFKRPLLEQVCQAPTAPNLVVACGTLRRWPDTAQAHDRGALLWDAFWARLEDSIPADEFYRRPFSAKAPLDTPGLPNAGDPRVARALSDTVADFARRGWPLDAPVVEQRHVDARGGTLPLYGGCHEAGYFVIACKEPGALSMGPQVQANSYLQVVHFGPRGVHAHTLLAHGQQESALTPQGAGAGPVARYARQAWLRFPFREADIARDPAFTREVLRP
ncbi:penicillin acylase family protein [Aquabacterium sp. CECT 9606]|uniref:penicillin acylase family protein n=1 Tax=Aquabacterium sp. CECT 9606 TaxID=2845822 RepID=UPI001E28FD4A|nr:penicillin acylase family protein [Aquabacterium sp. CECT 9606]CAH0352363.1 Aculeacin-A acylase [Aquabacterium sp. CECT 9606]